MATMDRGRPRVSDDINCSHVQPYITAMENEEINADDQLSPPSPFLLAYQLVHWGVICLEEKVKDEDNYPQTQEEIIIDAIRRRTEELKSNLIIYEIKALKRFGVALQDYTPGADAAYNGNLMNGLETICFSILQKELARKGEGTPKKEEWGRQIRQAVTYDTNQPTYELKSKEFTEAFMQLQVDVSSLLIITSKIEEFLDKKDGLSQTEYGLALQRLFHLTGEFLKGTDHTPNLSQETRKSLNEKNIPVDLLSHFRDTLVHYQLVNPIKMFLSGEFNEYKKPLEEAWKGLDIIMKNEVQDLEEGFFKRLFKDRIEENLNEQQKQQLQKQLEELIGGCKTNFIACLMTEVKAKNKDEHKLCSPEVEKELQQYAEKMKSRAFPDVGTVTVPDTTAIADIMIFVIVKSKKAHYEELRRELEKTRLPEDLQVLMRDHQYQMGLMTVEYVFRYGGAAAKKELTGVANSIRTYMPELPEDQDILNKWVTESQRWMTDKERFKRAKELLQGKGNDAKAVMKMLNELEQGKEKFTPKRFEDAVKSLKSVDENEKGPLYFISVEWVMNKYFKEHKTVLIPFYDKLLWNGSKVKPKARGVEVDKLIKEVGNVKEELYINRMKETITELLPLQNPSAIQSEVLNFLEVRNTMKSKQNSMVGVVGVNSNESGENPEIPEDLVTKFRNFLAHLDDLATPRQQEDAATALVEMKDKVKGELSALEDNIGMNVDEIEDIINTLYQPAMVLQGILCPGAGTRKRKWEDDDENEETRGKGSRTVRETESCLTDEDIENVVVDKDDIDPEMMTIDSEKMIDALSREIQMDEYKFDNYLSLAKQSDVKGNYKSELTFIAHRELTYGKYLTNIETFSGEVMHGMMMKHILGDLLRGDIKGVCVDMSFLVGGGALENIAFRLAEKGKAFMGEGSEILGRSLAIAAPFIGKGIAVFVAYDLYSQVKALKNCPTKTCKEDAIVGIVGDSVQVGVDVAEVGVKVANYALAVDAASLEIEIAGGAALGVSAVLGPIGLALNAVVFVGTDIYKAVREVEDIDEEMHLTGWEKFDIGVEAFLGLDTFMENEAENKKWNNHAVEQALSVLKNNPHIKRYVFPSYVQVVKCSKSDQFPDYGDYYPDVPTCCREIMSALNSNVDFTQTVSNIKWSRSSPDEPGENIFCKPVPQEAGPLNQDAGQWAPGDTYYCQNAIGITYDQDRTDDYTMINLGVGNSVAHGFQDSGNIFIINRYNKTLIGGNKDDSFIFHRDLTPNKVTEMKSGCDTESLEEIALDRTTDVSSRMIGHIDGGGGQNTIDANGLRLKTDSVDWLEVNFPKETLTYQQIGRYPAIYSVSYTFRNINKFLGITDSPDLVTADCQTNFIDGRRGYDDHHRDLIFFPDLNCPFSTTIIVHPLTEVHNDAPNGKFQYFVQGEEGRTSTINLNKTSTAENTIKFKYSLNDVAAIAKSKDAVTFSFVRDFYDTPDELELQNSFNLTINERAENTTYLLTDSTRIVVGRYNMYALQNTDRVINETSVIEEYMDITKHLNMYLVVHSKNQVLTISGQNNDVLTNDPKSATSHFVSGAGKTIFSLISGQEKLTMDKLPINDTVIHYYNNISIDSIDLRGISAQVKKDLNEEMTVDVSSDRSFKDDVILNLVIPKTKINVMTIRLKNVAKYFWYSKIQIVLDTAYSLVEANGNFRLVPLPLTFDDANVNLIVIHPRNVVHGMKIKISKNLINLDFARNDDALIITNSLGLRSHRYPTTVVLKGFYTDQGFNPKMLSLIIDFEDMTLVLNNFWRQLKSLDPDSFLRMKKKAKLESFSSVEKATMTNRKLFAGIKDPRRAEKVILENRNFISAEGGWLNPLAEAVKNRNTAAVRLLTELGRADATVKDIYGHSPLYYAVNYREQTIIDYFMGRMFCRCPAAPTPPAIIAAIVSDLPVVKYVTEKLVHRNELHWRNFNGVKKSTGSTLLHYAANSTNENLDVVEYLIKKGGEDGDITARDRHGVMPLYYAVKNKHSSIIRYFNTLIKSRGDVPLSVGVVSRNLTVVEYFVQEGADIYEKDAFGKTPLFYAFQDGADTIIDYLIGIIKKDGDGQVLAYPIITGDMTVMAMLMKKNASINGVNAFGKTPLHYAALTGNLKMVTMLCDRGADVEAKDQSGRTPLDYSVKRQHAQVVEYLCKKMHLDPLVVSAKAGKKRLVLQLVKNKSDLERSDDYGNTLLHLAVSKQSLDLVKYLVEKGADTNSTNNKQQTPLHLAAASGNLPIVKILVGAQARANALDSDDKSTLDYALEKRRTGVIIYICKLTGDDPLIKASRAGCLETVKFLVRNGADIHTRDKTGDRETLLHKAVMSQEVNLVKYFVEKGIDPNVVTSSKLTPLHYVAMAHYQPPVLDGLEPAKCVEMGKYLIGKGANVNAQDSSKKTPLDRLITELDYDYYYPLMQLLLEKGADAEEALRRAESIDEDSPYSSYLRDMKSPSHRGRRQIDEKLSSDNIMTKYNNVANDKVIQIANATGWANIGFLNWAKISFNWLSNKPDNSQSPETLTSRQIDANSTIMLIDLLIRKATGQKYVGNPDRGESPMEIQAKALNVVRIFEETLEIAALEFGVNYRDLNFDPIALQSNVIRHLRLGESSQIPKTLYDITEQACSGAVQCDKFLEYVVIRLGQNLRENEPKRD